MEGLCNVRVVRVRACACVRVCVHKCACMRACVCVCIPCITYGVNNEPILLVNICHPCCPQYNLIKDLLYERETKKLHVKRIEIKLFN